MAAGWAGRGAVFTEGDAYPAAAAAARGYPGGETRRRARRASDYCALGVGWPARSHTRLNAAAF